MTSLLGRYSSEPLHGPADPEARQADAAQKWAWGSAAASRTCNPEALHLRLYWQNQARDDHRTARRLADQFQGVSS